MNCDDKRAYKSEFEAKRVRKNINYTRKRKLRIYKCNDCFHFHLTSKEKFEKPQE